MLHIDRCRQGTHRLSMKGRTVCMHYMDTLTYQQGQGKLDIYAAYSGEPSPDGVVVAITERGEKTAIWCGLIRKEIWCHEQIKQLIVKAAAAEVMDMINGH